MCRQMSSVPAIVESLEGRRLLSADYGPSEAFLTDGQLLWDDSMTVAEVRAFLDDWGGYFSRPVPDVDGTTFDLAQTVVDAGAFHGVNPQVLLTTLQKEHSGITRQSRPTNSQMAYLMGSGKPSTATLQIYDSADRFSDYYDELTFNGVTRSGWRVGVPKSTVDGVVVTPATKATAGQFTYTPYAGGQWGGSNLNIGGVWLFQKWWTRFGFDDRQGPLPDIAFDGDAPQMAVTLAFSEPVGDSLAADDVVVRRADGFEVPAFLTSLDLAADGRSATLTFPGIGGTLPDGDYSAVLAAGAIADGAGNLSDVAAAVAFHVLAGDANGDRSVTIADFAVVRSNFGGPGVFSEGDFNRDGEVTIADFAVLRENFGTSLPPLAAAAAAPLPDDVPPGLAGFRFIFDTRQAVGVDFDEPIEVATFDADDVTVRNDTTGQTIPAGSFSVVPLTPDRIFDVEYDVARLGPMPDGEYTATLAAGAVTDLAGNPLAEPATLQFHVLAGDADRDRAVTIADFAVLRQNFGAEAGFRAGDFDYDGRVTIADFAVLRQNFGQTLPAPATAGLFAEEDSDEEQRREGRSGI